MIMINDNKITITDNEQQLQFINDGNGDYYFTLLSNFETRPGNYYSFTIKENNVVFNYFKWFIEQEFNYVIDENKKNIKTTPYFIINNDSIKIADQNKPITETEHMKFVLSANNIKILFSDKFPSTIRINGSGRVDHYPFFIPVIDLFNSLQNINLKNTIKGTGCYKNIKSGNTVSITGDGGNAFGYFGSSYKKLAPSWKLYEYWRENPNQLSDDDLIDYYIKEYFNHRLSNLDVFELLNILKEKFGSEILLLCHEPPGTEINKKTFCHRRVVADFIELKTGIVIPEISDLNNTKTLKQRDYKPKLKKLIKRK